jgi:hypothetical protein
MRSRVARVMSVVAIGLVGIVALCLSPSAVASGDRLVVNVPEPFEVSGRIFPAGSLAVRHLSDYSPTTRMEQIMGDTGCLGILLAQRRPGEEQGLLGTSVVFTRSPLGHLVLVGYTTGASPGGQLYLFRSPDLDGTPTYTVFMASR